MAIHNYESWEDKHRCELSAKNGCRVVKDYLKYGFCYKGWCLFCKETDSGFGVPYMSFVSSNIKYCPFCGKELL